MTYWNPVERYGVERFAADLANAGGAGLITPDITPDARTEWTAAADAHDLDKVYLVAPSSTDERIAMTVEASRGFVYAAAVMGVTGARTTTSDLAGPLVERTRATARSDRPAGGGRDRGQHRRPGRGRRGLRRRRHRGQRLRPHPPRPPRRPRRRPRGTRGADRRTWPTGCGVAGRARVLLAATLLADGPAAGRVRRQGRGALRGGARPAVRRARDVPDRHRRGGVLADEQHRQAPDAGVLRLHQLPRHLHGGDVDARLGDDPARRRRPRGRGRGVRDHRPGARHRAGAAQVPRPPRQVLHRAHRHASTTW